MPGGACTATGPAAGPPAIRICIRWRSDSVRAHTYALPRRLHMLMSEIAIAHVDERNRDHDRSTSR